MSAARIRRARELTGLSINQAAKLLNWSRGDLLALEADPGAPPTEIQLRQLTDLYGASMEWLQGAEPQLPETQHKMLRDANVSSCDRDTVLEFAGMLAGRPPQASASVCLSRLAQTKQPDAMPLAVKVNYVKAQRQTRKHHCHWPGCTKQVPPAMWGCKEHWFRLPLALRRQIWSTYAPGQEKDMTPSAAYLQVADDVQHWIRTHTESAAPTKGPAT